MAGTAVKRKQNSQVNNLKGKKQQLSSAKAHKVEEEAVEIANEVSDDESESEEEEVEETNIAEVDGSEEESEESEEKADEDIGNFVDEAPAVDDSASNAGENLYSCIVCCSKDNLHF
jgi:hypothetical protein